MPAVAFAATAVVLQLLHKAQRDCQHEDTREQET